MKSFATDESNRTICVFSVITGTHTGVPRGAIPPTGRRTVTNYVDVMEFAEDKIRHMTKISNPGWAIKEPGWDI